MKINHAVVPVAGLGTRLLPVTAGVAKEMLPLGRKPTLQYIAEELSRSGVNDVVLVSSESKSSLANYFQTNQALEDRLKQSGQLDLLKTLWSQSPHSRLRFNVALQREQRGLGHAILCAADLVLNADDSPTHFVVALGDCVIGLGGGSNIVERMIGVSQSQNADIVIAFELVSDEKVSRFGIAAPQSEPDGDGIFKLGDVIEKPSLKEAPSNLAIAARYVLSVETFEVLKNLQAGIGGEIQLTDAIRQMIAGGATAYGVRLAPDEIRFDVGNLVSYTESYVQFAMADPELNRAVRNAMEQHRQLNE